MGRCGRVKFYPRECLDGPIRYRLNADERGVWYDLLILAGACSMGGYIQDLKGRPLPRQFIANRLNVTVELLERTIAKCVDWGLIQDVEEGLRIVNWRAHQSEYERQKPYRQKKRSEAGGSEGA